MSAPLLSVRGLTRRFGGVTAADGIDLDVYEHEAHAIIGPNGAGKTTFIAQVAGSTLPDAGTIKLDGRSITHLPAHRRARLGLARSFQITSIFATLTVIENAVLAVQAAAGHAYRMWSEALGDEGLRGAAPRPPRAGGPRGAGRGHGRRPLPRGAPPTRDRDGPRDSAAPAASRRADGGHGTGGVRPDGVDPAGASGANGPCCSSSTTWTRYSPSPTGSRSSSAGGWSLPAGRKRSGPIPRCGAPTSGRIFRTPETETETETETGTEPEAGRATERERHERAR